MRPEAMPNVQFLLNELYAARAGKMLTLAAFDALGGAEGVMPKRGEDVYRAVEPSARNAFPRMVRALVTQFRSGKVASAEPLSRSALSSSGCASSTVCPPTSRCPFVAY